jgi:ActR/RegA family two-component response regulator
MMANARGTTAQRIALVVHPDITALSAFQGEFLKHGIATIVARDLPTALLAVTQHYFDIAVVAETISETGDGWALGGVLRMVFPKAFLATITPTSDVHTLKNAINNGIDEIFETNANFTDVVASTVRSYSSAPGKRTQRVQ